MADPITNQIHISLPGAGQTRIYALSTDTPVRFEFDLAEAVFNGIDGNLEISVEGGGTIILENFKELADSGSLPTFEMINGEQVSGDVYLFAFADDAQTAEDLETAADGAGGGSGAGEYSDDPGTLFASLNALGGQGDAYDSDGIVTLSGVLGNVPPVANDDFAEVTEEGDPDFIIGRHIIFVPPHQEGPALEMDQSEGDAPPMGEFFPLAGGGGFYINYPNPPQVDEVIEGNVIDNDNDPDGDDSLLRMYTIDYMGQNHEGVDEPGVEVNANDTVIMGKYGILVIDKDGTWDYTLIQEWADELDEGESFDEVFEYTITDEIGAVSNTATLTITVHGSNDMPEAHDDLNVQAVEVGDSTGYGLVADVDDAELGTVNVHADKEHDYTDDEFTTVYGNVLAGDDQGGATDSDVDGDDSPDGQSMFVVGVYSHGTQTVDYELPNEGDADFVPSEDQAYGTATMDADDSVTVYGTFGVLTIEADGDYTYTLYTEEDGERYLALNSLNYGSEENTDAFTYGIMDDSGAFSYANLTFTVNGANDKPVAHADENNVVEFGIKNAEDDGYSAMVSGNVIEGDAFGGVADEDVDDGEMFVATVSSQTDESGTLYSYAGNPDNEDSVTINGEYGTLTIHADGSYEYVLQNGWENVQALNETDEVTDVFTYTLTNSYDDGVYSDPVTLTINVTGANDNPVAMADTNSLTESVNDDPAAEVSGNVLAGDDNGGVADTDVDNVLEDFSVTGVTSNNTSNATETDTDGYDFVLEGQYGTLYLNEDGSYKYVEDPDATDSLNYDSDPVTDVFTYTMSDNVDTYTGTSSATLTITISGANDNPVARNDWGVAKEAGFFTDGFDATGNVLDGVDYNFLGFTWNVGGDSDVDDSVLTVTHVVSDDTTGNEADVAASGETAIAGKYGTLYIGADGSYRYELNDDAENVDSLNVWDVEDESFTYTVIDEHGGSATATLTIEINGSNDAPVGVDDTNATDAVVEKGVDEPGDAMAKGNVLDNDTDIDHSDSSLFVKAIAAGAEGETAGSSNVGYFGTTIQGTYGSLYIARDGSYTYTLNNNDADTQALAEGETAYDEFTYTVSDPGFFGAGKAYDTATLSIEITGSNDAAVITGDDNRTITEDNASQIINGLLTASGDLDATDVDNTDDLFNTQDVTDEYGGHFVFNSDGTWTYEIDNDTIQHLGEVDGVNDGFTKEFTVTSIDGTEHVITVNVAGENDAPEGADFTVQGNEFGQPISIDFDVAPITDVEDDYDTGDSLETSVRITSLPENGTLYYDGVEVTQADIDNETLFGDLDNFTYVGDAPENQGLLLGSRESEDAGLDTWGEKINNSTRELTFDSDGDGTDDVTITISMSEGKLKVYDYEQNHIGHGLANKSNNGITEGETLTVDFNGKDVSYAEIGFDGLGGYFDDDASQAAVATWEAYDDGVLVASGTVSNETITWTVGETSGTITGGDGDIFQSFVLDQSILNGAVFDQIVFGTSDADDKDWNSNWELQYIDVEFAQTDSFTYRPVDSEGADNDGDPYVVTIDVLPGAYNEDPTAIDDTNSVYEPNDDNLASTASANVLSNDIDPDNTEHELSVTKVEYDGTEYDLSSGSATFDTEYGTMTFNADGSYTYTATDDSLPDGAAPTETFKYYMTDGDSADDATLTITVNGLNDGPDAIDDGVSGLTGSTWEVTLNAANGFDAPGVQIYDDGTTDSTVITGFGLGVSTGSGDNSAIETTQGEEKVTFKFDMLQSEASVTLADYNVTDNDDSGVIILLDENMVEVGRYELGTDLKNPTVELTGSAPFMYVVVQPGGDANDGFYIESITGTASDWATTGDAILVTEDSVNFAIDVLGNDTDPDLPNDTLSVVDVTQAGHGTVTYDNGQVYYTPDADYNGPDSFTYTITDEDGLTDTATVYVYVTPENDAPAATDNAQTIDEDTAANGNVLTDDDGWGKDSDVDGDSLSVTKFSVDGTEYDAGETADIDGVGTLTIGADGAYTFTPDADWNGTVPTATYTVSDGNGGTDTADLDITVDPVNDAPTLDLSMGTVTFEFEEAGYNNMLGIYTLDEDNNPINPEIILENVNASDLNIGDVLATYEDGQELHYFLVSVGYGSTPQGDPEFVWNDDTDSWDVSFNGTAYDARFDNPILNPNDPEATFKIDDLIDGRILGVDDQFLEVEGSDDDDFDDVIVQEHDNPGYDFENTFVEDGGPVHITGEVNITDVDSDNMAQAVITLSYVEDSDSLNVDLGSLPSGITGQISADGLTVTLTGVASLEAYEEAIEMITFNNSSQDPSADDRTITVQVWDDASSPVGEASNTATTTIHVVPVNDAPVAVHDGYHEISITTASEPSVLNDFSNINADGESVSGNGITITAASEGDLVETIHGDLGLKRTANDYAAIDGHNGNEDDTIIISVDNSAGAASMTITLASGPDTGTDGWAAFDGTDKVKVRITYLDGSTSNVITIDGNDVDANNAFTLSGTSTSAIASVTLWCNDNDDDVAIHSVSIGSTSSASVDMGSAAHDTLDYTVDGNVLDNDFDVDGTPTVTEVDGQAVTTDTVIHGTYGDLTIDSDGQYEYTLHTDWDQLDHSAVETFEYTISDGQATDTASLEFSLNVDNTVIDHNATPSLVTTAGDDVIFPVDGDTVDVGEGADSIVIDHAYLGDGGSATITNFEMADVDSDNADWFTLGDHLDLGDLEGVSVALSASGTDLNLVFSDLDGNNDMTITLQGVNPITTEIPDGPQEISDSAELNHLIQQIIDSPDAT